MSTSRAPHDFEEIRGSLNGMLRAEVYAEYYRIARYLSSGSILELGTGQGAGTVAFALGVKDSGRAARVIAVDQFFQVTRGPHPASKKTHGSNAVAVNLRSFEDGLRRYGVRDHVDVHARRIEDLDLDLSAYKPVDVLAIDVDGMLDRDLGRFYDDIAAGGWLILDDYRNAINEHGSQALERHRRMDRHKVAAAIARLSSFERRRLLGKHLFIYRCIERLEALGLLSKDNVIGCTAFCRKVGDSRFSDRWTSAEADAIEESIVDDFRRLLEQPDNEAQPAVSPPLHQIRRWLRHWLSRT